jgi:hypothetical protein
VCLAVLIIKSSDVEGTGILGGGLVCIRAGWMSLPEVLIVLRWVELLVLGTVREQEEWRKMIVQVEAGVLRACLRVRKRTTGRERGWRT